MHLSTRLRYLTIVKAFLFVSLLGMTPLNAAEQMSPVPDSVWQNSLKAQFFGDHPIVQSDEVVELEAPVRAEDGAVVPIRIHAKFPQTADRYIKTISLIIDKNPAPLAGKFQFTPQSGRADLALRIRVNEYSPVRVIAETNDGKLFMDTHFVKASGGCSAPVGTDLDAAMKRLGKIRFKTKNITSLDEPVATQLAVSHPNITGMQKDQVSLLYIPPHFVTQVDVKFEGEPIFSAETTISVSENPNFRFYFVPQKEGTLTAEITDSKGMKFTQTYAFDGNEIKSAKQEKRAVGQPSL
ncbi:MAG TPA: quinoprotein dehydrogenase-associated SoxYZ-like carrier [Chromatiales bacterium]|nr:quinoprotein dehydrogenase-associated SoxYZ-like carrier [Thiotrichales bacterium]HIP69540.1 quinoprotein dehydrogenase-associated SoxYZ-like carrier [Chromatiales bacterium]